MKQFIIKINLEDYYMFNSLSSKLKDITNKITKKDIITEQKYRIIIRASQRISFRCRCFIISC